MDLICQIQYHFLQLTAQRYYTCYTKRISVIQQERNRVLSTLNVNEYTNQQTKQYLLFQREKSVFTKKWSCTIKRWAIDRICFHLLYISSVVCTRSCSMQQKEYPFSVRCIIYLDLMISYHIRISSDKLCCIFARTGFIWISCPQTLLIWRIISSNILKL